MMITSATSSEWYLDTPIENLVGTGLRKSCVARLKLFTLDNALIASKAGKLSANDQRRVATALKTAIPNV